jgi:hypothetical protein
VHIEHDSDGDVLANVDARELEGESQGVGKMKCGKHPGESGGGGLSHGSGRARSSASPDDMAGSQFRLVP